MWLDLRAGLYHAPWKSNHGWWSFSMAWLHGPTFVVRFLENSIYKVFRPLTRCEPIVDQEEWPCTKRWMCWFFEYMPKKGNFERKKIKFNHSNVFIFSSLLKYSLKKIYNNISLPWVLVVFFNWSMFFASPVAKPVGPCHWIR